MNVFRAAEPVDPRLRGANIQRFLFYKQTI